MLQLHYSSLYCYLVNWVGKIFCRQHLLSRPCCVNGFGPNKKGHKDGTHSRPFSKLARSYIFKDSLRMGVLPGGCLWQCGSCIKLRINTVTPLMQNSVILTCVRPYSLSLSSSAQSVVFTYNYRYGGCLN